MKKYNRIMLGAKSIYAEQCFREGFIGGHYGIHEDLTQHLYDNWKDFNAKYRPVWMQAHPGKSKVSAGLACGMLWTICKGLNKGDVILSPDGQGNYYVGTIESNYYYVAGGILPHRRKVNWLEGLIERSAMSKELQNSTGSIGTTCDITSYAAEIERLMAHEPIPAILSNDATIEDPSVFALEKHLEDFLVQNWKNTQLGKTFDIYEEDGELVGQQYPSDTGPIDILAISKDKKTLLVVELKRGRVSDSVLGQIQRYMGFVKEDLAEANQEVKGVIIGAEEDVRIRRALSVTQNIEFYRYEVKFELIND